MKGDRDDRLGDVFQDAAERIPEERPLAAARVILRGRRRRWTRVAGAAATGVAVAVALLAAPRLLGSEDSRVSPAQVGGPSHEGMPGAFAFLALREAGLMDLSGDYYSIEGVTALEDAMWHVGLQPRRCIRTDVVETCVERPGDGFLEVVLSGQEFRVSRSSGEMPESARRSLSRFRKSADVLTGDRWVFSTPQIDTRARSPHIDVAMAWLGDTEPSTAAEVCRGLLLDASANVLSTSRWREFPPPSSDDTRFGGTSGFSGFHGDLGSVQEAAVECEEVHGLGWEATDARIASDGDERVEVELTLTWEARPYQRHYTHCALEVVDAQGNVIGHGEHWRPGPRQGDPPYTETVVVDTDAEPASASGVESECGPVSELEFESRPPSTP